MKPRIPFRHRHRYLPSKGTTWACSCGRRFDPGCPYCHVKAGCEPHECIRR